MQKNNQPGRFLQFTIILNNDKARFTVSSSGQIKLKPLTTLGNWNILFINQRIDLVNEGYWENSTKITLTYVNEDKFLSNNNDNDMLSFKTTSNRQVTIHTQNDMVILFDDFISHLDEPINYTIQ